jgi:hypothetical protein
MPAKEGIRMARHGGLTAFAQSLIEYVEDLLTASPKESFTKVEMLVLLNAVKNDRALLAMFDSCDRTMRPSASNG